MPMHASAHRNLKCRVCNTRQRLIALIVFMVCIFAANSAAIAKQQVSFGSGANRVAYNLSPSESNAATAWYYRATQLNLYRQVTRSYSVSQQVPDSPFMQYITEHRIVTVPMYPINLEGYLQQAMPKAPVGKLQQAASDGDIALVRKILKSGMLGISHDPGSGWTPLMWAAARHHDDVLACLIKHHQDVNVTTGIARVAALHIAVVEGDFSAVKALIAAHADVNASDIKGLTPLHYALLLGFVHKAKVLLANGASPTFCIRNGVSPQTALAHSPLQQTEYRWNAAGNAARVSALSGALAAFSTNWSVSPTKRLLHSQIMLKYHIYPPGESPATQPAHKPTSSGSGLEELKPSDVGQAGKHTGVEGNLSVDGNTK